MNTLTYRFTLDTFKCGIQRILQGFQTGEHTIRTMEISLKEATEPYKLPLSNLTASMYVRKPGQTTPSINACTIDGETNLIKYTILDADIETAGVVEMQLKLINSIDGTVLVSPKFGMEVWESNVEDEAAEQTTTYTSLTEALAAATAVSQSAIVDLYIDDNDIFTVVFGDGTTYTSNVIADAVSRINDVESYSLKTEGLAIGKQNGADVTSESPYYHNNSKYYADQADSSASSASLSATGSAAEAVRAESYAKGGTNSRSGEATDNAKYFMQQCMQIAGSLAGGGILPMGTIQFSQLPTENLATGIMYNVTDAFTSDSRFKDGGDHEYGAGTNVYYTADGKWDCFAGVSQTINGKNGNNITLDGEDLKVTGYSKPNSSSAIAATDTINQALGKLEKALDGKVSTETGKSLTSNDYTNADKQAVGYLNGFKFGGLMTEAQFEAGQPYNDDVVRFTYVPIPSE